MREIVVPQLNANDDGCVIQKFYCNDGEIAHIGDLLVSLETSKAVIDLECESDGFFYAIALEHSIVKTGEVIAFIFPSLEELNTYKTSSTNNVTVESTTNYKLSNQAQEFAHFHHFTEEELSSIHKKIIKLDDLKELLKQRSGEEDNRILLTKNQKQVSKIVSTSYTTIPRAFLLMKVYCDEALTGMRNMSEKLEEIVGFGEVLPVILAAIKDEFPFLYGRLEDEDTFILASTINVGVTIDVGTGLYIPVIQHEDLDSVKKVTEVLMEYKYKAIRNSFTEEDLMNGHITISLNTSTDVVSVLPIILPNQIGMISVGAVMKELALQDGAIVERSYIHLGLAYDHRVVNGFYAVDFLTRIKSKLESFDVNI